MKTFSILNSMKSGYFMLVVCVTLLLGASACGHEEFRIEIPEVKKGNVYRGIFRTGDRQ